jgi:DNA-binding MarR family transcriptional regulator
MPSGGKQPEPDACGILANLWRLVQSVLDESAPGLEAEGLSPKTFFLLETAREHPFPAELARRMHLPPPTVTYMIKQLEQRGFLERQAVPGDLRKFRLVQTAAGRKALSRGREILSAALCQRLQRVSQEDVLAFARIIERLAANELGQGS